MRPIAGNSQGSRYAWGIVGLIVLGLALAGPTAVAQDGVTARFDWSPTSPEAGQTVEFDASDSSSDEGAIVLYEFDFDGDEVFDAEQDTPVFEHTYQEPGEYTVILRVTDEFERTDTTQDTITVQQADSDDDGIPDSDDNCPDIANEGQTDTDGDGTGDACDADDDGDGIPDSDDNCPLTANEGQTDTDGDGTGDACDATPEGGTSDSDGDGIADSDDNCPQTPNEGQADFDGDAVGDACDPDRDGDGVDDDEDECPDEPGNPDNAGCPIDEPVDTDDDGIPDTEDNCPDTPNGAQSDMDGDGLGDVCDETPEPQEDDTETRAERCQRLFGEAHELEREAAQAAAEGNESQAESLMREAEQTWTRLEDCVGEPKDTPCGSISLRIADLEEELAEARDAGDEQAVAELSDQIATLEERLSACKQDRPAPQTCQGAPERTTHVMSGQVLTRGSYAPNATGGWAFLAHGGDAPGRALSVSYPMPEMSAMNPVPDDWAARLPNPDSWSAALPGPDDQVLAPEAGSEASDPGPDDWMLIPMPDSGASAGESGTMTTGNGAGFFATADGLVATENGGIITAADGKGGTDQAALSFLAPSNGALLLAPAEGRMSGVSPGINFADGGIYTALVSPSGYGSVADLGFPATLPAGGVLSPAGGIGGMTTPGGAVFVGASGAIGEYDGGPSILFDKASPKLMDRASPMLTPGSGSNTVFARTGPNAEPGGQTHGPGSGMPAVFARTGPQAGPQVPLFLPGTPEEAATQARALSETYDRVADCLAKTAPEDVPSEECQKTEVRLDEAKRSLEIAQARNDTDSAERLQERVQQLKIRQSNCQDQTSEDPNCLELATSVEELEARLERIREEEGTVPASLERELEAAKAQLEACREDRTERGGEQANETREEDETSPQTVNETLPETPEVCKDFQLQLNLLQAAGANRSLGAQESDRFYGDLWDCLETLFPGVPPEDYPEPCRELLNLVEDAKAKAHAGGVPIDEIDTDRMADLAQDCAQAAQLEDFEGQNGAPGPGAMLVVATLGLAAAGAARRLPRGEGPR